MECNSTASTRPIMLTLGSNPPMRTIEADIYEAFAKAGGILQANAGDPVKVHTSFERSS